MDLQKQTGEQLAKVLSDQYQLLIQTQNNIRVINEELKRRDGCKRDIHAKKDISEKDSSS